MIDLHCHPLPGIDDGPADEPESLELLEAAVAAGTRVLTATPHFREDYPLVTGAAVLEGCARLRAAAARAGHEIEVVPGGEVAITWAVEAADEDLRGASYRQAGTDLLVETPYGTLPGSFEELLFAIGVRGFRVLLAHPERNPSFQREPRRLAEIVRRGVLVQVNAGSLTHKRRRSGARVLGLALIEQGLAHVIASDAHSADWRRPSMAAGVAAAERVAGARARWMVTDAPAAILDGEPLPAPPAGAAARRLWRRRGRPGRGPDTWT